MIPFFKGYARIPGKVASRSAQARERMLGGLVARGTCHD